MERGSVAVPIPGAENKFYLCVKEGCNRKYKTTAKLVKHCVEEHQLVISESPLQPVVVTKENKKSVEREKSCNIQRSIFQEQLEAAKRKKQLEEEAKRDAEEEYRKACLQKEIKRLYQPECCLCLDPIQEAAGVVSPCGHGSFCFVCVSDHFKRSNTCPICRGGIGLITKLFI